MKSTRILIIAVSVFLLGVGYSFINEPTQLGSYTNYNTWDTGTTNTTVTVNTTSTQVLASVSKWAEISNPTTASIFCKLDDLGTTAISSTVTSSTGLLVGPHQASTTVSTHPSVVQFGECTPGSYNCIPFKGTVNCASTAAATISVISK